MPEDGSDHLPPPATPPAAGTQLLNDYLQHIQEFKRMKPAIAVDGQGRHAWIRTKTPWLQGHMDVQLFDSGILAASSRGRLLVPYTSLYEEKHYTPPVALTLKMHGAFDWTDMRGREFQTPGNNELWFRSGVMDLRHSTMHAGEWSALHLSMQAPLVERWLADGMLHDKARRLLEQCLQPRGQGIMQVHPMQADMSATMRQAHALMTGLAPMQTTCPWPSSCSWKARCYPCWASGWHCRPHRPGAARTAGDGWWTMPSTSSTVNMAPSCRSAGWPGGWVPTSAT